MSQQPHFYSTFQAPSPQPSFFRICSAHISPQHPLILIHFHMGSWKFYLEPLVPKPNPPVVDSQQALVSTVPTHYGSRESFSRQDQTRIPVPILISRG